MTIERFNANPRYATMRLTTDTYHIMSWVPRAESPAGTFGGYWLPLCSTGIVGALPDDPDAPSVERFDQHPRACGRCVRGAKARGILR